MGPTIVATCWAVTALGTIFVGARIYVRGVILKKLHSDDYFSILALVSGSLSCLDVTGTLDLTLHLDLRPSLDSLIDRSSGILQQWKTHCCPYNRAATRCYLMDYNSLLSRYHVV